MRRLIEKTMNVVCMTQYARELIDGGLCSKHRWRYMLLICYIGWGLAGCMMEPTRISIGPYHHDEQVNIGVRGHSFEESGDQYVRNIPNIDGRTFYLDIDPGDTPIDNLYFIFTNAHILHAATPKISFLSEEGRIENSQRSARQNSDVAAHHRSPNADNAIRIGEAPPIYQGSPEISEYNRRLPPWKPRHADHSNGLDRSSLGITNSEERNAITPEGSSRIFITDIGGNALVRAIAGYSTLRDGIYFTIWVDNTEWCTSIDSDNITCRDTHAKITRPMLEILADKFLLAGAENDIYNWITDLLGEPWGYHENANLIDPTKANTIDILLYDINQDASSNGGTLGFFWSKDNFRRSVESSSNEQLMFYLDSRLYSVHDGIGWDFTDYWPQNIISTLAHEFQHMVIYYQRSIKDRRDIATQSWLNEMLSMGIEDIISDRLGIAGPRGIRGPSPISMSWQGRLPQYNCENHNGLTIWDGQLSDYSTNYAFISYLLRNYGAGDAENNIIRKIYDTGYAGPRALTACNRYRF